jgi:predicted NAD-dependent protein-ADP-ribosyltransferase YbiA (DUF1768 family)
LETPTPITSFRGPYAFLSNFAPAQVWYEKQSYRNVEVAYQAAQCADPRQRAWIRESVSPGEARRRGERVTQRDDWDSVQEGVLRHLVRQKFRHHPRLREALVATGHAILVGGEGDETLGRILMEVRLEAQQELLWSTLKQAAAPPQEDTSGTQEPLPLPTHPATSDGPDGVVVPPALSPHEVLLQLCADLQKAGIYLSLSPTGTLIAGPTIQVKKHPRLLEGIRAHKAHLLHLIEDSLAYQLFGTNQDDKRFDTETCPECQQAVNVVTPPRRLALHRLPHGETVCPGSARAQHACAAQLLDAFLEDRAVPRRMAVLTWTSFEGNFRTWALERGWLRPPKPYLMHELDTRFERMQTDPERPMWQGLTLTQEQWYGEDEARPVVQEEAQAREPASVSVKNGKVTLRA